MPNTINLNDSNVATIDRQNTRLTFADSKGKVLSIKEIKKENTGEYFNLVKVDDNGYYYSTVTSFEDSSYIQKEQIFYCNNSLNPFEEAKLVFEKEYEESNKIFNPSFFHISNTQDDDVVVLIKNSSTKNIDLVSIKYNPGEIKHS